MPTRQLQLWKPPPKPKRAPAFKAEQWAAIESTFVSAKRAYEACPGVPLRDVCRITIAEGWGTGRVIHADAFATRENFKEVGDELLAKVRAERPAAVVSLGVGFDQRPYKHRNPLYPSFEKWLRGHRPAEAAVQHVLRSTFLPEADP